MDSTTSGAVPASTAAAFGCNGNTIRLLSGTYLDLLDPRPEAFTIEDVAGALSKLCRFGGQISRFYSVAEHSWHCWRFANDDGLSLAARRAILMHDAAEAFCGDVVKPLKILLPEYAAIEMRLNSAIAEKWNIDFDGHDYTVGVIDRAMLIAERRILFSPDSVEWAGERDVRVVNPHIGCWSPSIAERQFLCAAYSLGIN